MVFVILTIGENPYEIARALPVGFSDIFSAVSFECSLPTKTPSLIRGVIEAGVPSSSKAYDPLKSGILAPSVIFKSLLPNFFPNCRISFNLLFSYTLSASERCPNASCTKTPANI